MSDPIADMLTRIRNAQAVSKKEVELAASTLKMAIADVLVEEGYLESVIQTTEVKPIMTLQLKYYDDKKVIEKIKRISKPSLRHYVSKDAIPSIIGGLGVVVMSTSRGVMSGKKAKTMGLGGEVLCSVY
jgi:small subunit ribosomal protein S8